MAVILAITYQKKLGLPNYSSHSCSVSLTVEIPDVSAVEDETNKLYQLLQASVDHEIQEVGFMPDASRYGMNNGAPTNGQNTNGNHANGYGPQSNGNRPSGSRNGNTHQRPTNGNGTVDSDAWNCTPGQCGMIKRLVHENNIPKDDVEALAQQLFGVGVKQLDKMQASQVIEELLERCGKRPQRSRWQNNRQPARS